MSAIRSRIVARVRDWGALAQTLADCGISEFDLGRERLRMLRAVVPADADPDAMLARLKAHPNVDPSCTAFDRELALAANGDVTDPLTGVSQAQIDALTPGVHPDYRTPAWALTWHHGLIDSYHAWEVMDEELGSRGIPQVRVAINDSGIVPHADLPAIAPENRYESRTETRGSAENPDVATDTIPSGQMPYGPATSLGHGLMVAGQIFAQHNSIGVSGVAPGCTPVIVRGTAADGYSNTGVAFAIASLVDVAEHYTGPGVRVVSNNSWGWFDEQSTVTGQMPAPNPSKDDAHPTDELANLCLAAVNEARAAGVLLNACAHNHGHDLGLYTMYPAELPGVMCVGSIGPLGEWVGHNYGVSVDIAAPTYVGTLWVQGQALGPGDDYGPYPPSPTGYWSGTGTSSATPLVTGAEADALSMHMALTDEEVHALVRRTATPFIVPETQVKYPNAPGTLNLAKLVMAARATNPVRAGHVFAYVGFFGRYWDQEEGGGRQSVWPKRQPDNSIRTTLNGQVWGDLAGFSDKDVIGVELLVNGVRKVAGRPQVIQGTATFSGAAAPVTVRAVNIDGTVGERVRTTFDVTSLTVTQAETLQLRAQAYRQADGTYRIAGTKLDARTVTVNGEATTSPAGAAYAWTYPAAIAEPTPGESVTFTVADNEGESLTLTVEGAGLAVDVPAEFEVVTFPVSASGSALPGEVVQVFNDDTNELLAQTTADAATGAWSMQIGRA